ncbi:MAG: hypothetical protein GXP52_07415 [Deltaproteobacteria bacterium]|nr:hypothetical protein [Deltaproteobacteria bacterium]
MIDLHSHILPGLDDGPDEMDGSMAIVKALVELGFTHLFATPHHQLYSWRGLDSGVVEDGAGRLNASARKCGVSVQIHPGMEYDLDEGIEERIADRPGKAGYILVDPGFYRVQPNLVEMLAPVQVSGIQVLIVHPERNDDLLDEVDIMKAIEALGIRFIGNLGSLGGMYGKKIRRRGIRYLEEGRYWALATDIHRVRQVGFLEKGMREAERIVGSGGMNRLLQGHPKEILMTSQKVINAPTDGRSNQ